MSSNQEEHNSQQSFDAEYEQFAYVLNNAKDGESIDAALTTLLTQEPERQIAFLQFLAEKKTKDAADIAQAVFTFSTHRLVRKEARRALVKLEAEDIYAEWEPAPPPSLIQAANLFQQQSSDEEEDEDDEDNEDEFDLFGSELGALLASTGIFDEPVYADVVGDFLESWAQGDFESAYEILAEESSLRASQTEENWIAQRQQWYNSTHPARLRIAFINPHNDEGNEEESQETATVDVCWSLELATTPDTSHLPEVPTATIVFNETDRHWFWTSYTLKLNTEDEEWYIVDMIDKGSSVLQLSEAEIQAHLKEIDTIAVNRLQELQEEELESEVEDEDEDEEDIEEEEEEITETLERIEEAVRVTTEAMYYHDALLAQSPANSETLSIYRQNALQASIVNDPERAAAYLQRLLEVYPDQRQDALPLLGRSYDAIAQIYQEEENENEMQRFQALSEKTLREALALDPTAETYLALAKIIVAQERDDEARNLLTTAKEIASKPEEQADIEVGLGLIAKNQEQWEQALQHFLRAKELEADFDELELNIGLVQNLLQHYDDAVDSLSSYIEGAPDEPLGYMELATAYIGKRQLAAARQTLQDGLEWNPDAPGLLSMLAIVYAEGGDPKTAQKYLNQAIDVDPDSEFVQHASVYLQNMKAQLKQAKQSKKTESSHKTKKRR